MEEKEKNKKEHKESVIVWSIISLLALICPIFDQWAAGFFFMFFAVVTIPKEWRSIRLEEIPIFRAFCGFVGICAVISIVWFTVFGDPDEQNSTPFHQNLSVSDVKVMVIVICQDQIKNSLKSPSSADFPWTEDVSFDGYTATMSSYVDADNSFGAKIRTHYTCSLNYKGGDVDDGNSWALREFKVLN